MFGTHTNKNQKQEQKKGPAGVCLRGGAPEQGGKCGRGDLAC